MAGLAPALRTSACDLDYAIQNAIEVLEDVAGWIADDEETGGFQNGVASQVMARLPGKRMVLAIDLDDEPAREADEIEVVALERVFAAKRQADGPKRPEDAPEAGLRWRGPFSPGAGLVAPGLRLVGLPHLTAARSVLP